MLQVAKTGCQVRRASGKIVTLNRGDVIDYDEGHSHLRPIEGAEAPEVDFDSAGEDELFESEFETSDLAEYIKAKYDVPVRVRSKKKLIEKLLDCRYRDLDPSDLNRLD